LNAPAVKPHFILGKLFLVLKLYILLGVMTLPEGNNMISFSVKMKFN